MNESAAVGMFLGVILGAIFGISIGWGWGGFQYQGDTQDKYIHWVEYCWPNKPSWSDPEGTCWIDGRRVITERRE